MSGEERLSRLVEALGPKVRRGELLSGYTSFRIGGPADLLVRLERSAELLRSMELAARWGVPYLVLGAGTNVLVADEGVRGLVLVNGCAGMGEPEAQADGRYRLWVESGVRLPALVSALAKRGWSGMEWAMGIPGTVGGAVVANAGAFGGCFADSLSRLEVADAEGRLHTWGKAELQPGYRTSALREEPQGRVVTRVELVLERGDGAAIERKLAEYAERRRETQPTEPSAGSVFKNPPGVSAGQLIEEAGLKGFAKGDAQVSPKHANFVVNHGRASASDVLYLVEVVKDRVQKRFGIELELEIELIGLPQVHLAAGRG